MDKLINKCMSDARLVHFSLRRFDKVMKETCYTPAELKAVDDAATKLIERTETLMEDLLKFYTRHEDLINIAHVATEIFYDKPEESEEYDAEEYDEDDEDEPAETYVDLSDQLSEEYEG